MYVRLPLWLCNVDDLLHERGIEISHETVQFWWNRFGPLVAARTVLSRLVSKSRKPAVRVHCRPQGAMPAITHDAEMANSIYQSRTQTTKKTFLEMVAA